MNSIPQEKAIEFYDSKSIELLQSAIDQIYQVLDISQKEKNYLEYTKLLEGKQQFLLKLILLRMYHSIPNTPSLTFQNFEETLEIFLTTQYKQNEDNIADAYINFSKAKIFLLKGEERKFQRYLSKAMKCEEWIIRKKFKKLLSMEAISNKQELAPISPPELKEIFNILNDEDLSFQEKAAQVITNLISFECKTTNKRENDFGPSFLVQQYTQESYICNGDQLRVYFGVNTISQQPILLGEEINLSYDLDNIDSFNALKILAKEKQFLLSNPRTQQKLLSIIYATKNISNNNDSLSKNASSVITLLNYSGYNFKDLDFRNIQIPKADLSGSKFTNVNLSGSNCRQCKFQSATLDTVDFSNADLTDCKFGNFTLLSIPHKVTVYKMSKNKIFLAKGYDNGTIKILNCQTQKYISIIQAHNTAISLLDFCFDGLTLASAALNDSTIKLWDTNTNQCIQEYTDHQQQIECLLVSVDGLLIISASNDQTIRVWRRESNSTYIKWYSEEIQNITCMDLSHNYQYLVCGSSKAKLAIIELQTQKIQFVQTLHELILSVTLFQIMIDRIQVEICYQNGTISQLRWEISKDITKEKKFTKNSSPSIQCANALANKTLIVTVSDKTKIQVWKPGTFNAIECYYQHPSTTYITSKITVYVDFVKDENELLYIDENDDIYRISLNWLQYSKQHILQGNENIIISPNAKFVTIFQLKQKLVKIHNAITNKMIHKFNFPGLGISSNIKVSSTGKYTAIYVNSDLHLRNNITKITTLFQNFGSEGVYQVHFDVNDSLIYALTSHQSYIWNLKNQQLLQSFPSSKIKHCSSNSCYFLIEDTQDSRQIFGTKKVEKLETYGDLSIWDKEKQISHKIASEGRYNSRCCCFSANSKYAAFSSKLQNINIWNIEEQKSEMLLHHHFGTIYTLKFASNDKYLICQDLYQIQVWDLEKKVMTFQRDNANKATFLNHPNFATTNTAQNAYLFYICKFRVPSEVLEQGNQIKCFKREENNIVKQINSNGLQLSWDIAYNSYVDESLESIGVEKTNDTEISYENKRLIKAGSKAIIEYGQKNDDNLIKFLEIKNLAMKDCIWGNLDGIIKDYLIQKE